MSSRIVPAEDGILTAVKRLQSGEIVAFPTETVYGLGADATNADAVAKIFTTKGRPSTNPLIVHVADVTMARRYAAHWPEVAETLAATYWPGPLTLVVEKSTTLPDIVTANGPTVGLRVPDHPVAHQLLQASGLPIAAPSANRSEEVSPTTAQHVADSLGAFADDLLILDGGPCRVGIESTVLDVTTHPPRLLRPGKITIEQLRLILGDVAELVNGHQVTIYERDEQNNINIARSPGQRPRHYAPNKPVVLMTEPVFLLQPGEFVLPPYNTPEEAAFRLYADLRRADADPNSERIVIVSPPDTPEWAAVHDRLRRAATPGTAKPSPTKTTKK